MKNIARRYWSIFKHLARFLKILIKDISKFLLVTAGISLVVNLLPNALTSDDMEDYLKDNKIDPSLVKKIKHKDIRVYHKANPLSYMHIPARRIFNVASYINNDESPQNESKIESTAKKVAMIGITSLVSYPVFLLQSAETAMISPFFDLVAFSVFPGVKDNPCYIMPPGKTNSKGYISQFTDIPEKYIQDLEIEKNSIFDFVIIHEAGHCDREMGKHALNDETDADIAFLKAIAFKDPKQKEKLTAIMKYLRAVSTFSRSGSDFDHATALGIDAFEKNVQRPDAENITDAQKTLKGVLEAEDSVLEKYDNLDQYMAVYFSMKDILKTPSMKNPKNDLIKRAAELYIEGIEYFAPKAPGVKPEIKPEPASAPIIAKQKSKTSLQNKFG